MALYKNGSLLSSSQDTAFDFGYSPGTAAPLSGIYRCMNCSREAVSTEGNTLPPQNHHSHPTNQGPVLWQLIVYADHRS